MKAKFLVTTVCFITAFFIFPPETLALVCSSPRKGVARSSPSKEVENPLGTTFYYYWSPTSGRCDTTPMLKKEHIWCLSGYPAPEKCFKPNQDKNVEMIYDAWQKQGCSERYWIIFNEPMGQGYTTWNAVYDAAFPLN